ncbi:hypothetical protein OSO01_26760 [Oceanobacillus sojae]|uniref:Uncharacterized protein n=1 Tax=Oceanobacillus sojae TaxID=582851 RepID=A0A511ZKF9_9BACI|nr:hypothetical protein OSO01_26760 [Oceanobacillus sojae]
MLLSPYSIQTNEFLTLHYTINLNHKNPLQEHLKKYTSYPPVNIAG